ncbi:MAG: tyrosine--tRNA ligase [Candidatus Cloacimonas sp.]|nr:tyrosine--tRNA ligase [Candidatus Cloacimonadota bacterium]
MTDEMKIIKRRVEEIIPEEELIAKLAKSKKTGKPLRVKYGIDPTGSDVHIGHLVPIRKMRELQDMGHTGVIIIGDFTAQIGDPTGRDTSRPPLSAEQAKKNAERYMDQLYTVLDRDKTEVRWQSEWFSKLTLADTLQMMGKFTLAQFMAHDTFRDRYEKGLPLGMHEIMYPILQGYDSVVVEADIELGATEQKFNILTGRDMQRYFGMEQQVALLFPILVGTDGVNKMGKSLNNYIAVFDPPNEKYGKVMSIPDSAIVEYFRLATNTDEEELAKIEAELKSGTNPKFIKQRLARSIVSLYHSEEEALAAEEAFDRQFSQGEVPDDIPVFDCEEDSIWIVKLLTDSGLCKSGGEARRMIKQNAVSVNDRKIESEDEVIELNDETVVKVGKRRYCKVCKGN